MCYGALSSRRKRSMQDHMRCLCAKSMSHGVAPPARQKHDFWNWRRSRRVFAPPSLAWGDCRPVKAPSILATTFYTTTFEVHRGSPEVKPCHVE